MSTWWGTEPRFLGHDSFVLGLKSCIPRRVVVQQIQGRVNLLMIAILWAGTTIYTYWDSKLLTSRFYYHGFHYRCSHLQKFQLMYSDLPNNRAANLINFSRKKHLPTRLLGNLFFWFLRTKVNSRALVTTAFFNLNTVFLICKNWSSQKADLNNNKVYLHVALR